MLAFALQAVVAFNLVCTGTVKTGPLNLALMSRPGTERFTIVYRVDLENGRYCTADCTSTQYLASVSATEINFFTRPAGDGPIGSSAGVNRETGLYTDIFIIGDQATVRQGTCERAPFTGFPQPRF